MALVTQLSPRSAAARAALALAGYLSDLVLPPSCIACREPIERHGLVCPVCWAGIAFIRGPVCARLGIPLPHDASAAPVSYQAIAEPPEYDSARAAAIYAGTVQALVQAFKFEDRLDLAGFLGRLLDAPAAPLLAAADRVVPVPLAWRRLWQRRFNQSAILADGLARRHGVPVERHALVRTRATASQSRLGRAERAANVAGAFAVRGPATAFAGMRVVLVDDVITTGATANACARALRMAGAARVDVVAVALVASGEMALL